MNCCGIFLWIFLMGAFLPAVLLLPAFGRTPQEAYIKASNANAGDLFGYAVAISGDTLVVGAPFEASAAYGINQNELDNSAPRCGAVYVYVRSGAGWTQQAYLKASNAESDDLFGNAVAISGNTLVVGARGESSDASGVNGNQGSNSKSDAGAAYVFVRQGTTWTQEAYLKSGTPSTEAFFGAAVGISGGTIVVGSTSDSNDGNGAYGELAFFRSGSAFVFVRNGSTWTPQAVLKASNRKPFHEFGAAVGIDGDTIVVGSPVEDGSATGVNGEQSDQFAHDAGAAYVFTRNGTQWLQRAYLKASNTGLEDLFGTSVAVSGNTIAVGARKEDSNAAWVNGSQANDGALEAGAVYVFTSTGTVWSQQAYLKAGNSGTGDEFGTSVAIDGDRIMAGAPFENSGPSPVDNLAPASGSAYAFRREGTQWKPWGYLKAANSETNDLFGNSVAVSGSTAAVGAINEDSASTVINGSPENNSAAEAGAAYVFPIFFPDPGLSIQIGNVSRTGRTLRIDFTFETGMPAEGWRMWESENLQSWSPVPEFDFLNAAAGGFSVSEPSTGHYRAIYTRPNLLSWPDQFFVRMRR